MSLGILFFSFLFFDTCENLDNSLVFMHLESVREFFRRPDHDLVAVHIHIDEADSEAASRDGQDIRARKHLNRVELEHAMEILVALKVGREIDAAKD